MKKWTVVLGIFLMVSAVGVGVVLAAEHMLTFGSLEVGYTFTDTDQPYEPLGITIGGDGIPRIIDAYAAPSTGHALRNDPYTEFSSGEDLEIELSGFTSDRVVVHVGRDFVGDFEIPARLEGWQTVGGTQVLVDSHETTLANEIIAPVIPLTVESDIGAIDFIRITYDWAMESEIIDDLQIQIWEGDPPLPPTDTTPPEVQITTPEDGSTTSSRTVSGYIDEDLGLAGTVSIVTPLETRNVSPSGPTVQDGRLRYFFADMVRLQEGSNTIQVTASDSGGNTHTDSVTVDYEPPTYPPPPPEWPDTLDIIAGSEECRYVEECGMEVTQVIQGWQQIGPTPYNNTNWTPLIAGKRTLVRVYGQIFGIETEVHNVGCMLRAYAVGSGEELPGSPISSMNRVTLVPGETYLEQRLDPDKSFNFILPPEWTEPGTVLLQATVNHYNGIPEGPGNFDVYNSVSYEATFHDTELFCISVNRFRSRQEGDVTPTWSECTENVALTQQLYPVSPQKLRVVPASTFITDRLLDTGDSDEDDDNLSHLAHAFRRTLGLYYGSAYALPCWNTVYLGLTDDTVEHRGMTTGNRPVSVSVASDSFFYRMKTGHEIGHSQGLGHVQGCSDPDDPYEPYPTYRDAIDGTDYFDASIGDWGVDIRADNSFSLISPTIRGDMMSYCGSNRWMSVYTWEWLYNHFTDDLGAGGTTAAAANPAMNSDPSAPPAPYLIVSGLVDADGGVLDPAWTEMLAAGSNDHLGEGAYTIQLLDESLNVLFTRHFDPEPLRDLEDYAFFREVMPAEDGTAVIRLSGGTLPMPVIVTAGVHKPTVQLHSPNGGEDWEATGSQEIYWTGYDVDGDPLIYTVFYSHDNGSTWRVIGADLEQPGLPVLLGELPGCQNSCRVRVAVSDGINQGEDTSAWPFTKEGQAPLVNILNPTSVAVFDYSDLIIFEALVTDWDDDTIPDENLSWTSDIDGLLGTGLALGRSQLSPGLHQITLTATDSDGMQGSDTIGIYINPTHLVWLPIILRQQ